uniref:COesterase domain-containing protein n=1 Tax=Heterorhabditis bacteriophora TaxID=37862 RepID=A0A1I7XP30_HETBA
MGSWDETNLNCILSDASVISNPESVVESGTLAAVDYFGVDECYGLPEANESKENRGFQLNKGHPVTEDKRVEILEK